MNRADVYALIDTERGQQTVKWGRAHSWGRGDCSSARVPSIVKAAVLTEEAGEVARAVLDAGPHFTDVDQLRTELVQVAAVAVAWCESLPLPDDTQPSQVDNPPPVSNPDS